MKNVLVLMPVEARHKAKLEAAGKGCCFTYCTPGEVTAEQIHKHYWEIPESERKKDWQPFNSMLKLIKKFDGLRIYFLG